MKCPHCGTEVGVGLTVCRGCGAEVQYGATRREAARAGCWFCFLSVILGGLLILLLCWIGIITPRMADWVLFGNGGKNGIVLLVFGLVLIFGIEFVGKRWMRRRKRGEIRFFRHYHRR